MAGRGGGLLTRFEALLNRYVLRRELLGLDEHGNKYFRKAAKNYDGYDVERRFMRTPKGDYDPDTVAPEWKSWLNRVRDEPPSPEEIARARSARIVMQQRALALDAEDAKRKFQAETMGQARECADQAPRMDRFLDQLSPQSGKPDGSNSAQGSAASHPASHSKQDAPYNPEMWKPGGS